LYGSAATGLGIRGESDIDLTLDYFGEKSGKALLRKLENELLNFNKSS
jgi:uncharacterized protein YlaN (UPF0358 family)